MATIIESKIMRSEVNLLAEPSTDLCTTPNADKSEVTSNSWADRSEVPLASNVVGNNTVSKSKSIISEERFFLVKRKDGSFENTSPFLIQKSIQGLVGEPKTIKKIRSGELLIEVINNTQASNLKKCTQFGNIPIIVSPHKFLNTSRGVISEPDLLNVTEDEIVDNLKDQNVIEARRIKIYRQDEQSPTNRIQIPTKHVILTFNTPNLPNSIKAGYLSCSVRPYIPNPLRCFRCQRFGHSKTSCRGSAKCGRCSVEGHDSLNCQAAYCCVNCKGEHPSYSRSCEKWKTEKEIQTIRTKQNLSYPEARKIVDSRTPTVGLSYAASAAKAIQKTFATKGTQTYVSLATQTDNITSKNQPNKNTQQNINKIENKPPQNPTQSQSTLQPISSHSFSQKLPTHKRTTQETTKKQPQKQNRRSTSDKNVNIKTTLSSHNVVKKKKLQMTKSTSNIKLNAEPKKCKDDDDDAIIIHTNSELSEDEGDVMSTSSELKVDTYI